MRLKLQILSLLFIIVFYGNASNQTIKFNNLSNDTISRAISKDISLYKLILSGNEAQIKKYIKGVAPDMLLKVDSGTIAKAFNKLNTNDKVSRTIWILEEAKNREPNVRAYIYSELLRIDFGKPSYLLNHMINNYFVNFIEKDESLYLKIRRLHSKMNR